MSGEGANPAEINPQAANASEGPVAEKRRSFPDLLNVFRRQKTEVTLAERQSLYSELISKKEIGADTRTTYATVLSDEYQAVQAFLELHKDNPGIRNAIPEYQKQMITAVSREFEKVNPDFNWKTATQTQKDHAFQSVFRKLLGDKTKGDVWTETAMLVTKRHMEAIQLGTEAHLTVTHEADRIKRTSDLVATSAVGDGASEVKSHEFHIPQKPPKTFLGRLLRGTKHAFVTPAKELPIMPWGKGSTSFQEKEAYRRFAGSRLYSDTKVEWTGEETFDPDRQYQDGTGLDAIQKLYLKQFEGEFASADTHGTRIDVREKTRVKWHAREVPQIDPSKTIEHKLRAMAAAQSDAYWTRHRTQLRAEVDMNLVKVERHRWKDTLPPEYSRVDSRQAGFTQVKSKVEGVGNMEVGVDGQLTTRLSELMTKALELQKPELEAKRREGIAQSVQNQITELDTRLQSKTMTPEDQVKSEKKKREKEKFAKEVSELRELEGMDDTIGQTKEEKKQREAEVKKVKDLREKKLPGLKTTEDTKSEACNGAEYARDEAKRKKTELETERDTEIPRILNLISNQNTLREDIDSKRRQIAAWHNQEQQIITLPDSTQNRAKLVELAGNIEMITGQIDVSEATLTKELQEINQYLNRKHLPDMTATNIAGTWTAVEVRKERINAEFIPDQMAEISNREKAYQDAKQELEKAKKAREEAEKTIADKSDDFKKISDLEKKLKAQEERKKALARTYHAYATPDERKARIKTLEGEIQKAELEIRKIEGVPSEADRRQKETLELYSAHVLPAGSQDKIMSRAVDPHFARRPAGRDTSRTDELRNALELHPHVPPAYLEFMRILGGSEVLGLSDEAKKKYETFAILVPPDMFLELFRADPVRRDGLNRIVGETLPDTISFYDPRLSDTDVQDFLHQSLTPELVTEYMDAMLEKAKSGTLGRMSDAEAQLYATLAVDRLSDVACDDEVETQTRNIETDITGKVEALERCRTDAGLNILAEAQRQSTLTREFLKVGGSEPERVYEAVRLASILAQTEHTEMLEKAMAKMRLGTNRTLEALISYISDEGVRDELIQLSDQSTEMIVSQYNAEPGRDLRDMVGRIEDIPVDDISEFIGKMLINRLGRDKVQYAVAAKELFDGEKDEFGMRIEPIHRDALYWGVEGDDLVVALEKELAGDPEAHKKAQLQAYRVEQYRKSQIVSRN